MICYSNDTPVFIVDGSLYKYDKNIRYKLADNVSYVDHSDSYIAYIAGRNNTLYKCYDGSTTSIWISDNVSAMACTEDKIAFISNNDLYVNSGNIVLKKANNVSIIATSDSYIAYICNSKILHIIIKETIYPIATDVTYVKCADKHIVYVTENTLYLYDIYDNKYSKIHEEPLNNINIEFKYHYIVYTYNDILYTYDFGMLDKIEIARNVKTFSSNFDSILYINDVNDMYCYNENIHTKITSNASAVYCADGNYIIYISNRQQYISGYNVHRHFDIVDRQP